VARAECGFEYRIVQAQALARGGRSDVLERTSRVIGGLAVVRERGSYG